MFILSFCKHGIEAFKPRAIEYVDDHDGGFGGDGDGNEDVILFCDDLTEDTAPESECGPSWLVRTCNALIRNDPSLYELEINTEEHSLDEDDLFVLAKSLRKNTVVDKIVFRHSIVSEAFIKYFASMVRATRSVSVLDLEELESESQLVITRALARNLLPSIRVLHFKGNYIDSQTAEAIGSMLRTNTSILEFRLCHSRITSDGISHVAKGLKCNRILRTLDLLGNGLDDVSVSKISNAIAYNASLEFLCLDFNDFGFFGVQAIANMLKWNVHLKELHLFGNRIDSRGADALAVALCKNTVLETLILSFNQIGDSGAAALANALTVNQTLTKIWFPSNSIGNEGLQAWGECLPKMNALEQLNVGDFFDDDAAEAVIEGLKRNMRVSVLYMECPIYDAGWMEDKLDFYLRLNKSGRSLLRAPDAPTSLWSRALARANQNESAQGSPDVLYFMLSERPDLFEFER